MFEFLNHVLNSFNDFSKSSPIIAGAISLWVLGSVSYFCRDIPKNIWTFTKTQLTTSLSFNDGGYGYGVDNFASFLLWFEKHSWSKYARTLSMELAAYRGEDSIGMVTGVGYGRHFFIYKKKIFILHRTTESKAGSDKIINVIDLTMFSRDKQIMRDLIEEFSYKLPDNETGIYKYDKENGWVRTRSIAKRPLSTVIIDTKIKNNIVKIIENFRNEREWYASRGFAYKKTFLLHGIHGTGKTSFTKAISTHFKLSLCILNLINFTDSTLEDALSKVPKNSLVLVEDFDSAKATKDRKNEAADDILAEVRGLSLSGILNALDGAISLDDTLVFLTTNVLETIDAALIRNGRVDHTYELKALRHKEIMEYIGLMFPHNEIPYGLQFKDILGCDLQAIYMEYKNNFLDFIIAIPHDKLAVYRLQGQA